MTKERLHTVAGGLQTASQASPTTLTMLVCVSVLLYRQYGMVQVCMPGSRGIGVGASEFNYFAVCAVCFHQITACHSREYERQGRPHQ